MKWYKIIGIGVLSVLLLAACSTGETENKKTVGEAKKVSHSIHVPVVHMTVGDMEVKPKIGSYQLKSGANQKEVEKGPIEELEKKIKTVRSEKEGLVQLYFEDKGLQQAQIRHWQDNRTQAIKENHYQFTLPKDSGEHVYEILAYYENGYVQYLLKVEVAE